MFQAGIIPTNQSFSNPCSCLRNVLAACRIVSFPTFLYRGQIYRPMTCIIQAAGAGTMNGFITTQWINGGVWIRMLSGGGEESQSIFVSGYSRIWQRVCLWIIQIQQDEWILFGVTSSHFAIKEIFGDVPLPMESQRASQRLSSNQWPGSSNYCLLLAHYSRSFD